MAMMANAENISMGGTVQRGEIEGVGRPGVACIVSSSLSVMFGCNYCRSASRGLVKSCRTSVPPSGMLTILRLAPYRFGRYYLASYLFKLDC